MGFYVFVVFVVMVVGALILTVTELAVPLGLSVDQGHQSDDRP